MSNTDVFVDEPEQRTTMTLSLSSEDKQLLKLYAVKKGIPVSKIIHAWIQMHCKEDD